MPRKGEMMEWTTGQQMLYLGAGGSIIFVFIFIILRISFKVSRRKLIDKIMNSL